MFQLSDGRFVGTTSGGGASGLGTLFLFDPSNRAHTVLKSFDSQGGGIPYGRVIQASDGALYGMTFWGGANNKGTIFKYSLGSSAYTVLHSFSGLDGKSPKAGLTEGPDGYLYGATGEGGNANNGVVFRIAKSGGSIPPPPPPSGSTIKATAPGKNTEWGLGSLHLIKWTHDMGQGTNVRLDASYDGGQSWSTVVGSMKNQKATSGSYSWRVAGPLTSNGRVRVCTLDGQSCGVAAGVVTIASPYVRVLNPNGPTHLWDKGTKEKITWKSNLGSDKVKVELSLNGGSTWQTLASATKSDGAYSVSVQSGWVSTLAKVRLTWTQNGGVKDESDLPFVIR
jgi:uncharacterized repeat protein (TIGR03803 family)